MKVMGIKNTAAYYDTVLIEAAKSFMVHVPGFESVRK
jgi:hypothetical protein